MRSVPSPVSATVAGEAAALLTTVTVASKVAEALGENRTVNVVLWSGSSVRSVPVRSTVNVGEPVTATDATVVGSVPLLRSVTVWVATASIGMPPNAISSGFAVRPGPGTAKRR